MSKRPADWSALRQGLPWVPARLFGPALKLAASCGPPRHAADFKGHALFAAAAGTELLQSAPARELFELLFTGNGSFAMLYSWELPERPLVNVNPKRLIVHDGRIPGETCEDEAPPDAVAEKSILLDLCGKEVVARRYLGPFTLKEAVARFGRGFLVSSAFIVRRASALSTKDRLVHNASGPGASSVNAGIEDDYVVQLDYSKLFQERLRTMVRRRGGRAPGKLHMCISDISKAYRRFGVRVADIPLLGLRADAGRASVVPFFDGTTLSERSVKPGDRLLYFDTRLPFGASSSVSSCVRVSCFVRDLVRELFAGLSDDELVDVCAYIDDFAVFGPSDVVPSAVKKLRAILASIGCPENVAKLDTPSSIATFLGLVYDLDALTVSLPEAKRVAYTAHLASFLRRGSKGPIQLSELQSVVGKLVHASGVYTIGSVFYQRLLAAVRGARRGSSVQLSSAALDDVRWWMHLLRGSSGTVPICPDPWTPENSHRIYTDASGTGWGCCFEGQWMWGVWSAEVQAAFAARRISISDLELLCLNFAVETWGPELAGRRLMLRCDNTASVANVTSQSSSQPMRAALLRRLYVVAAKYGIQLRSSYINTKRNEHADALSRGDLTRFFSLPQLYPLQKVAAPRLEAVGLLLDPDGALNPSSPAWLDGESWAQSAASAP